VVSRLRGLPVPLILVALVALAGVALGRIYHGPLLAQLVLGAAAGAVAVGTALRRAPAWSVAPASVAAMTGYVAWAVHLSAGRAAVPGGLTDVAADALRNGVPRLLTAMIPVEPQPDTVVVPVMAAWLAALAATELAVRAGRVLLGYLPPTLLFGGALYVVGPNAEPAVWTTLAYAGVAALGLALTARSGRAELVRAGVPAATDAAARAALRLRLAAGAAAGLAGVIGLAAVLGPAVAGRVQTTPVDPRRYVQPPQLDALDENPLIRLSGWALSPRQRLFDVRLAGATSGGAGGDGAGLRVRLAVLSDYDGVTWRVGATYRTAGRALPAPPAIGDAAPRTIRQRIEVGDLTGRLLPAAATPRLVDGVRVAYDPATGTLIRPEGLLPGTRYTVDSATQPLEVNLLAGADVPSGPAVARLLTLGEGVPEPMERLAKQLGADSGAPYQRALAIEQFLSEHYRMVADAPSGHAYPNLSFFLFGPRNGGGQRGTSEQFAAAYAVLARLLGLPARVVVGFRAPPGGGTVRAADALAWPEVLFDGVGWVPFNPLPQPNARPRPVEEDFRPEPEPSTPPPSDAPAATAPPSSPPASPPASTAGDHGVGLSRAAAGAVAAGALVLVAAGYVAAVPLLRRGQRRRRLGDPDPARRVAGAWLEVTDALRLAGSPAGTHLAATEVVAYAGAVAAPPDGPVRPAAPALDELADLVNVSAFGATPPDPHRVGRAGAQALAYARELRARQPWWRRLLWSLHPGPLRWHR
jgi:transglutaminase-like putative cysteine protease